MDQLIDELDDENYEDSNESESNKSKNEGSEDEDEEKSTENAPTASTANFDKRKQRRLASYQAIFAAANENDKSESNSKKQVGQVKKSASNASNTTMLFKTIFLVQILNFQVDKLFVSLLAKSV